MDTLYVEIIGIFIALLLVSRHILNLALSFFVTTSSLFISLLMFSVSALILTITSIPVYFLGCHVAKNVYAHSPMPSAFVAVCGMKTPQVVGSRVVKIEHRREWPHIAPTSAPGKY